MTWIMKFLFGSDELPPAEEADKAVRCSDMPWYGDLVSGKPLDFPEAQGGFGRNRPAMNREFAD